MALLKQCFCYSLRQGSFIIGTYSLIVYCVAFALELFITLDTRITHSTHNDLIIGQTYAHLPAPAYALCALYFFNFVMAAVLLFGLLVRHRKYLMTWTLSTALSFFPEAGMVLFMSLYYWPIQKLEYGVIEISYWGLRAIFNIFGALCVCSLYLTWRDEELILERMKDLNLAHLEKSHRNSIAYHNTNSLKRHSIHNNQRQWLSHHRSVSTGHFHNKTPTLGYQNFAYKWDSPVSTDEVNTKYLPQHQSHPNPSRTSQSFTSHANYIPSGQSSQQCHVGSFHENGRRAQQFNAAALIFDPSLRKSKISEWGIAGVGIEPPGYPPGVFLQRTKSEWNVCNEDYWSRAPPSRPVSMGYVNRSLAIADNSCDVNGSSNRGKNRLATSVVDSGKRMGGRRAASMDNFFYRYNNRNPRINNFTPEWSTSSLDSGAGDDDDEYINDGNV